MIVTIAQLNPTVGDIENNLKMIKKTLKNEQHKGTELLIFPELFLVGYPPQGLLNRAWFLEMTEQAIADLCEFSQDYPQTGILLGVPRIIKEKAKTKSLYNSALLIQGGSILWEQGKIFLPPYDLFDERKYFIPATQSEPVYFHGEKLGIVLGEDVWSKDLIKDLKKKGATLLINLAAFPFYKGSEKGIFTLFKEQAEQNGIPIVCVNQIGANDELIFEGRSFCLDAQGKLLAVLAPFQEQVLTVDTQKKGDSASYPLQDEVESVYQALVLGIKDYFKKTGFSKALLGLSGGIDSALVCVLAVEALGKDNVLGIAMPSPYSSPGSIEDARKLAENLQIDFKIIPINHTFEAYLQTLEEHFAGTPANLAEENIQARIRGQILMAFANKFGYLVLTTSNKSELSVGYCTLYGDMCGGLSVLTDVPKTMVYELARYINRKEEIIPSSTIEKAPSAELRPNQKDQDTLPPYDILDRILYYYLEKDYSPQELVNAGFALDTVNWVIRTVEKNEYKRRQAVPGLKVMTNPFLMMRRMPLAAKYEFLLNKKTDEVNEDGK